MAPQTRSTTKSPHGRSTRNSVYGRPPPSPPKARRSTTSTETKGEVTSQASNTKGTPWLACRDPYGIMTAVAPSETGEGVHIRWYYPGDDCEMDDDEELEVEMTISEERGVTPLTTAGPSSTVRCQFPQTPVAPLPYDAGSVIETPVKKAKPLQRSPLRIGDKGVRCLYEKGGVLRELNGGIRVVLRHPVGSSTNLSREQVELLEKEREERIVEVQVQKLLEQKRRLQEEEDRFSDSSYEDEMEVDGVGGTDSTTFAPKGDSSDSETPSPSLDAPGFCKGPNGELLDHQGRQMLGREGTVLVYSPRRIKREQAILLLNRQVWDRKEQNSLPDMVPSSGFCVTPAH